MTAAVFGFSTPDTSSDVDGWKHFQEPVRTYSANSLEQVIPLLQSVEAEAHSGFWVALMLSYEAAPAFDAALKTHPSTNFPLAWASVFDGPSPADPFTARDKHEIGPWQLLASRSEFHDGVSRIRELIAKGDTYQVNYTFPLTASFKGDPRGCYLELCKAQRSSYCAYLDLGRYKVLSLSPELFFELSGDSIRARPMKGTIKRGRWAAEDNQLAKRLMESAKDRAENVMIVDLLRNDLGKVSLPGTVKVAKLFELERYPTLWQMTSTVEGTLRQGVGLTQLMTALFPCGSITGAPKIGTMEIIRELEQYPRNVYTGTIGLIRPGGDCVFNVAIRTLILDSATSEVTFGVGAGITFDSNAESEYEESLLKSAFLESRVSRFSLLESILLEDGDFFLLERHLLRLSSSAAYFGFPFKRQEILSELARLAASHPTGRWKIRLLSGEDGELEIEAFDLEGRESPLRVALAREPVNSADRFLFHKTTARSTYDKALASRPGCDDVILRNERGEITESTVANVVVSQDGVLWTPPQCSGLLAGVFREELIARGEIRERVIRVEELHEVKEFFLINSVRKWIPAVLVD
jgi:para-aminobenzoate synthetase / 4-amino-4-deoxychorismate lyase